MNMDDERSLFSYDDDDGAVSTKKNADDGTKVPAADAGDKKAEKAPRTSDKGDGAEGSKTAKPEKAKDAEKPEKVKEAPKGGDEIKKRKRDEDDEGDAADDDEEPSGGETSGDESDESVIHAREKKPKKAPVKKDTPKKDVPKKKKETRDEDSSSSEEEDGGRDEKKKKKAKEKKDGRADDGDSDAEKKKKKHGDERKHEKKHDKKKHDDKKHDEKKKRDEKKPAAKSPATETKNKRDGLLISHQKPEKPGKTCDELSLMRCSCSDGVSRKFQLGEFVTGIPNDSEVPWCIEKVIYDGGKKYYVLRLRRMEPLDHAIGVPDGHDTSHRGKTVLSFTNHYTKIERDTIKDLRNASVCTPDDFVETAQYVAVKGEYSVAVDVETGKRVDQTVLCKRRSKEKPKDAAAEKKKGDEDGSDADEKKAPPKKSRKKAKVEIGYRYVVTKDAIKESGDLPTFLAANNLTKVPTQLLEFYEPGFREAVPKSHKKPAVAAAASSEASAEAAGTSRGRTLQRGDLAPCAESKLFSRTAIDIAEEMMVVAEGCDPADVIAAALAIASAHIPKK